MEHHHAHPRSFTRGTNHLSQNPRKTSGFAAALLAVILILPLSGGGGAGSVVPVPATFIVQSVGNGASYNAYLSASSTVPQFTEKSFQTIMQVDIEGSVSCLLGCGIVLLSGSFNQTATIQINKPGITISGTPASIIFSQTTFNTANFNISGTSFTFQGARIDDFARRNSAVGGGSCSIGSIITQVTCHIPFVEYGSNCFINSAQMFNVTSSAVYLTRLSSSCTISFNTIIGVSAFFGNATQAAIGIVGSGRSHRISNNVISFMAGGAGIQLGSGTINNALHSFAVENTLFHNEYGVQTISAIDMHINDNTIYNSSSYGIFVNTALVPSTFGPLTISGNTIGESGQGICCGSIPGAEAHIQLQGSRCCWKSVSIVGNSMLDRNVTLTTKTGIEVVTLNYENLTITGNAIGRTVNPTTILLDVNPPDKSWIITANPGFNPQPVRGPLTAGATPFTYTNNDAYMEQLAIITLGDTTSLVCRGITQILTAGETTPVLNTLDTCVFTYVVTAPTYDVLPLQG